jgi:hypothetical protein
MVQALELNTFQCCGGRFSVAVLSGFVSFDGATLASAETELTPMVSARRARMVDSTFMRISVKKWPMARIGRIC